MQWHIEGASADTGAEVAIVVDAESERDALAAAKSNGLFVSRLRALPPALPSPAAMEPEPEPVLDYRHPATNNRTHVDVTASRVASLAPGEQMLMETFGIAVTTSRVVANGTTYAVANIGSVSTTNMQVKYDGEIFAGLLGAGAILYALMAFGSGDAATGIFGLLLGTAVLGAAIWSANSKARPYQVVLNCGGRLEPVFLSTNRQFAEEIANAISSAIVAAHRT